MCIVCVRLCAGKALGGRPTRNVIGYFWLTELKTLHQCSHLVLSQIWDVGQPQFFYRTKMMKAEIGGFSLSPPKCFFLAKLWRSAEYKRVFQRPWQRSWCNEAGRCSHRHFNPMAEFDLFCKAALVIFLFSET